MGNGFGQADSFGDVQSMCNQICATLCRYVQKSAAMVFFLLAHIAAIVLQFA